MNDAHVRIGIIGCGQIGSRHIERYMKIPGATIVGVADLSKTARDAAAEAAGGAKAFKDFRELLAMDEVQAVDVCLHNNLHAPVTAAAFKAGKHVFCEKPIAGSYADGLAMVKAAKRYRCRLSIQIASLFQPATKAARRLIEAGRLGKPYFARSVGFRRRGRCFVDGYGSKDFVRRHVAAGGALYDMGIYHISQILHLLGNPSARTITGGTYQEIDMYADRRRTSRFDVEELGLGYVRLADGVTLIVEESWAIHLGSLGHSCVVGPKAGLSFEPDGLKLYGTQDDLEMDSTVQADTADRRRHMVDPAYAAFDSPQHHWIATLNGSLAKPIDTAAIALNTMLISEGVYLSQKLGREVTAAEVVKRSKSTAVKNV